MLTLLKNEISRINQKGKVEILRNFQFFGLKHYRHRHTATIRDDTTMFGSNNEQKGVNVNFIKKKYNNATKTFKTMVKLFLVNNGNNKNHLTKTVKN